MVKKFLTVVHMFAGLVILSGAALMRNIQTKKGSTVIQAFKIYPYQSLINPIQQLVVRDRFLKNVECWQTRVAVLINHFMECLIYLDNTVNRQRNHIAVVCVLYYTNCCHDNRRQITNKYS